MTAEEQQRDHQLNAIGRELYELRSSGRLDFDSFKALFHRALAIYGTGGRPLNPVHDFSRYFLNSLNHLQT